MHEFKQFKRVFLVERRWKEEREAAVIIHTDVRMVLCRSVLLKLLVLLDKAQLSDFRSFFLFTFRLLALEQDEVVEADLFAQEGFLMVGLHC